MKHKLSVPTMKFFANTRTQRHTAFVVLLVWLFALASSVANACMLETRESHPTAVNSLLPATGQAPAALSAQKGTDAGLHDDSHGARESCLKVCDDGTHTLPKVYSGVDHNDPGPTPLVATLWTGTPNVVAAPRRPHGQANPIVGPPLWVRYARLAL